MLATNNFMNLFSKVYQSPIILGITAISLLILLFQQQIILKVKQLYWLSFIPGPPNRFPLGIIYLLGGKNVDLNISKNNIFHLLAKSILIC